MKTTFTMLLASLLSYALAASETLEQFFPWLSPNPIALGTSITDLKRIRPAAKDMSIEERNPGEPFNGGLYEKMSDGSYFLYSFYNDKLLTAYWGVSASPKTGKLLLTIRNTLLQTCGEPTFGKTGRTKREGGVSPIIWESYPSHVDKNYRLMLIATSQSGIEVHLIDELNATKRGIKTEPPPYDEVAEEGATNDRPSEFVDLLNEARSGRLSASSTAPEVREPKRGINDSVNPTAQQPALEKPSGTTSQPSIPVEESSTTTRWSAVAVAIVGVIGLLWLLLKKRK